MIEDARRVLENNTSIFQQKIEERVIFMTRVQAFADMARSLLENGNDEEIVRSYQSVVDNALDEDYDEQIMDSVQPLSPDKIETVLLAETRDLSEIKDASNKAQWFLSEEGMVHLQLLLRHFWEADITPEMSRDKATRNMQFVLNGDNCLDFPANFPKKMPTFRAVGGQSYEISRGSNREDVCKSVVKTVVGLLRGLSRSSRRVGRDNMRSGWW